MQSLKNFVKRNAPVFFLGLIVLLVFVAIILSSPGANNSVPAGFKKVEESVFDNREPTEPTPEEKPTEYASQTPSPESKGKPYFYGEYNPSLRDKDGYPTPPLPGAAPLPASISKEALINMKNMATEVYQGRLQPTSIVFTENGFSPTDTSGYTGTPIIWTNKTAKEIKIVETVPTHEALKNGVVIKAGATFSFRPLKTGTFTYLESTSGKYGSVNVLDVTTPLIDETVDNF